MLSDARMDHVVRFDGDGAALCALYRCSFSRNLRLIDGDTLQTA